MKCNKINAHFLTDYSKLGVNALSLLHFYHQFTLTVEPRGLHNLNLDWNNAVN